MLLRCSGWSCQRMISVSNVPGGNPVALKDPDHFAVQFQICPDCHANFCDRCVPRGKLLRAAKCRDCGGKLVDGSRRQQVNGTEEAEFARVHAEGVDHLRKRDPQQALAAFDRAIAMRQGYVEAYFNRACALRDLGRTDAAIAAFEQAAAGDPRNPQALFNIGLLLADKGDIPAAVAAYDRALTVEPKFVAAMINKMVALLAADRCEEILVLAEEALRIDEADASADHTPNATTYLNGVKGAALLKLGRNEAALAAIDQAINDGPDSPDNYLNRARALERLGRTEEAANARRIGQSLR